MSNVNVTHILSECVSKFSDDDVKYLYPKLTQNLSGDLADALLYIENISEVDKILSSAENVKEFFNFVDVLIKEVDKEYKKRPYLALIDNDKKSKKKKIIYKVSNKNKRS